MTDEHIKEHLSLHYIGLIASSSNCIINKPVFDYGVDLSAELIESYRVNGENRYSQTGKSIDFQLKCTTQNMIFEEKNNDSFKYDLKVKNYNDLIKRRNEVQHIVGGYVPLVLIIVILPKERENRLNLSTEQMCINASAFWFYPDKNDDYSINKSSKRVKISRLNRIDLDFFPFIFNLFYKK